MSSPLSSSLPAWRRRDLTPEGLAIFQHPSGYTVEAKESVTQHALERLLACWPRGQRIGELFADVSYVMDDLLLLHRNGLIELRCVEAGDAPAESAVLRSWESSKAGYATTPYHTRIAAVA